jgi:hypothetical protein
MFENQPQLVRDLHKSNKLEPHLDNKYQQALELQEKFMKAGQLSEEVLPERVRPDTGPIRRPSTERQPTGAVTAQGAGGHLNETCSAARDPRKI